MRSSRTRFILLLLTIGDGVTAQAPDRIFHSGTVLTVDAHFSRAEAVAVSADSIYAIGSNADVLQLAGNGTNLIDLRGRTLIPGFVDAHSHLFSEASNQGMTFRQAQGIALHFGVTALGNLFTTEDLIHDLQAFESTGGLAIRTSLYMTRVDYCGEDYGDWYSDYPPVHERGERLRIGGVKIFTDGGNCGLPLATSFEYRDGMGDLFMSQSELNAVALEIHDAGYQLAMHALGDRAIAQAQNAIEHVLDGADNTPRHRIEHNAFIHDDILRRYSETGAVAVLLGVYPTCAETKFGALTNTYGADNVLWMQDWRSLLNANPNIQAAWHSDYPFHVLSPIRHLFSYVTRREVDVDGSICRPPDWLAEHAISVEEALTLMTSGAAHALDWDDEIGSIEVGKLADLVVLSDDPTSIDPNDIVDINVLATFMSGNLVYCRQDTERACGLPVATEVEAPESGRFALDPSYPNPFDRMTTISFSLETATHVELAVFDVTGRRVAHLVERVLPAGRHEKHWDAGGLPPGVYVIRMHTVGHVASRKTVLLP